MFLIEVELNIFLNFKFKFKSKYYLNEHQTKYYQTNFVLSKQQNMNLESDGRPLSVQIKMKHDAFTLCSRATLAKLLNVSR